MNTDSLSGPDAASNFGWFPNELHNLLRAEIEMLAALGPKAEWRVRGTKMG